jgi:VWFA-related protein
MLRPPPAGLTAATAILAIFTPLYGSSSAATQETFRSAIDLVSIQATVRDARGRTVHGLTAADFEVLDNGRARPVVDLRSDTESPLSVAVLVDMSGSMRDPAKITMARQAFQSMLGQLRPGRDEAAVYTFDSRLHERVGFTGELGLLSTALADFRPFGATSLYDATADTARRLADRPSNRHAIVVLTDGLDTSSTLSAAEVSGLASSIDVPVYVVATVPPIDRRGILDPARSAGAAADLRDLADWTGGRFVFATTLTESVLVATSILDELRQQYVLAIEAAPEREWRRLDIRLKGSSATVKARSGYFGG